MKQKNIDAVIADTSDGVVDEPVPQTEALLSSEEVASA